MAKDKKTRLLEELIKSPETAGARADEAKKLGLDPAKTESSVKAAKSILDDPDAADQNVKFAGLEYPVKLALLNLLSQEGAGAFLARLQRDEKDKGVSKAIGAAIHAVRAQGQNVADMRDRKAVKFEIDTTPPDSYVSPIDTEGNRLVLLARLTAQGRMNVFHVVAGDTQGLSNFEGLALTRATYKRFVRMAEAQMNVPLASVTSDYAAWLVAEAARVSTAAGLPTPSAYEEAKTMIEPPVTAPEHPLHAVLDRKEVEKEADSLVAKSDVLHRLAECAFWVPDESALEKLAERVKEADESKVAVGEDQKRDLRLSAARKTVKEYFEDPSKRAVWTHRLKETAYLLATTERPEEAKIAWATSMALERKDADVEKIPFATELTEKIVRHAGPGGFDAQQVHEHGLGAGGITPEMRAEADREESESAG